MKESETAFHFKDGDPWSVCQLSGFKVRHSQLRERWDGLRVWNRYWEPKHPSLDVPPMRGQEVVSDPTGRPVDNFVIIPVVDYGQ